MKHFTNLRMWLIAALVFVGGASVMADKFVKIANHSDVTAEGVYLIVDVTSKSALTSANGTTAAPTAVPVTITNDVIEGEIDNVLKWQFTAVDGGYMIYPVGDNSKWLYSTDANNGVRVGTNANKAFELNVTDAGKPDYKGFKHIATNPRYLGVYNNQDWRAYTSIHANIEKSTIELFKLDTSVPVDPTINAQGLVEFLTPVNTPLEKTITVSGANLTGAITISGAVDPFTVNPTSLGAEGGQVTITYNPTAAGTHTATLTLSSEGAPNKTIDLAGVAIATEGKGTEQSPFTCADVKLLNNTTGPVDKYWVKGYIVGVPTEGSAEGLTKVTLQAPFAATAVALSDNENAGEEDLNTMIGVQLPAGDIRTAINLLDNPENLKREVSVYGTLEGYFSGAPGVKNLTDYKLGWKSGVQTPTQSKDIWAQDGKVMINAEKAAKLTVFDITGKKVIERAIHIGMNEIEISINGVYVIKVGDITRKVIL